jgi:hypothetical protein
MADLPDFVRSRISRDLASRIKLHAEIRLDKIPTSNNLFLDAPFCRDNFIYDAKVWSEREALRAETLADVSSRRAIVKALKAVSLEASPEHIVALRNVLVRVSKTSPTHDCREHAVFLRHRAELYLSEYGDLEAHAYCVVQALHTGLESSTDVGNRDGLAAAIRFTRRIDRPHDFGPLAVETIREHELATCMTEAESIARSVERTVILREQIKSEEFKAEQDKKDAELKYDDDDKDTEVENFLADSDLDEPGKIVVPNIIHLEKLSRPLYAEYQAISSIVLPLVEFDCPAGVYEDLSETYPWAESAIESIVKDLGRSTVVKMRPVLFVGSPGCGKTRLAFDLLTDLGIKPMKYNCAGVSDGAFSGTSRQWSTVRTSIPMQHVKRTGIANPGILLDEIEKAGTSHHNGNLLTTLLEMLERSSAKSVFDPALEIPVDLSSIVWVATANSLDNLPSALRDRFRIVNIPDPRPEHIEVICRSILDDKAGEEELRREWIPDLDADELDNLRKVWRGGSIRPLVAAVHATLQAREQCSYKM